MGHGTILHLFLGIAIQTVFNPAKSAHIKAAPLSPGQCSESIKGFAEVQVVYIHSLFLIHMVCHLVKKGG